MSENVVPYLSEHASAENSGDNGNAGYNPPEEDKKIIRMVESLYGKAKKFRKRTDGHWTESYKMFRGRQWKEVRPSYRSSEVINLVFQTIQSMIPMLTDSKPKLEFLPTVSTQYELADIINKVCENDWEHNNWAMTLCEVLLDGHIYGDGFAYVGFNPKAEMGLGSIEFESQDNFYCFPDPSARDINGKRTKYFITAEPTDISELRKQYPKEGKWISSDVMDFAQGDKSDIYQVMFKSPTDSKLIVEGPSGSDTIAKNQALKITFYSKDDEFEEEEKIQMAEDGTPALNDDGAAKTTFVQKLKYPNGRKIVIAGGVLVENGPIEFDDGNFPYCQYRNYILPREFWSAGDIEQLEGPQKTFNKIVSYALDVMALMGNPIYIVDNDAGIDTDNLFNKPGLVVEKNHGSEVRRESGVELPAFILPLLDRYKQYMDGISGQTDLSRGVETSGITAASAIDNLQQAQQTRIRLKSRNLDAFLKDFGKLYMSRLCQFYSVPRIVRVSGDEGADQFFYFHIEKLEAHPETGQPFTDGEGNPITKRYAHKTDEKGQSLSIEIQGDFDIRVATGTSLPFAKKAKADMAMKLFQLGVIDDEELLKDLDYPNYEAVLRRVNEKKTQAMQQQMQTEQQTQQAEVAGKQAVKATPTAPTIPPPLG